MECLVTFNIAKRRFRTGNSSQPQYETAAAKDETVIFNLKANFLRQVAFEHKDFITAGCFLIFVFSYSTL